jgi:hypothetical protein
MNKTYKLKKTTKMAMPTKIKKGFLKKIVIFEANFSRLQ